MIDQTGPVALKLTSPEDFIICEADRQVAYGSNELKACPFCGNWAFSSGTLNKQTGITVYTVACTQCTAQVFASSANPEEARVIAVKHWNRREKPRQ